MAPSVQAAPGPRAVARGRAGARPMRLDSEPVAGIKSGQVHRALSGPLSSQVCVSACVGERVCVCVCVCVCAISGRAQRCASVELLRSHPADRVVFKTLVRFVVVRPESSLTEEKKNLILATKKCYAV